MRIITLENTVDLGFVVELVNDPGEATLDLVKELLTFSAYAVRRTTTSSTSSNRSQITVSERSGTSGCVNDAEHHEVIDAFSENRKPTSHQKY